jgi:CubicO group peptidase (beta-lactamase class C family)
MSLLASLSAAFDARADPDAVPVASAAVIVDQDEVSATWGAPHGTLFQAASISKPVAALVALRLVAQGSLALDADVNQYLTSWQLPDGGGLPPVTTRQLLSHGGALTVSGVPGYRQGEALPSLTDILDGVPPANTPAVRKDGPSGLEWRYSGGGYVILQQLLEDVTGRPFAGLASELVFQPARMDTATYAQPQPSDAAAAHIAGEEVAWRVHPELATAGLWCTPADLVRLAQAIQAAVAGGPGALLPRYLALEMVTPQTGDFGLGLRLSGDGASEQFSHGGENYGYECALIGTVRGRNVAAVMTSSDKGVPLISSLLSVISANTSWRELSDQLERPDLSPGEE